MMKLAIVSKYDVKHLAKKYFKIVKSNPDFVLAYGGDGTLLFAEKLYPNIPKIFVKHKSSCRSCELLNLENVLKKVANGNYKIKELIKLEANVNGKKFVALNDINIHYIPPEALRFFVYVNGKRVNGEFIGDGVVVCTPFGSTAYFKSITRKTFNKGIGIAFNNTTRFQKPKVVSEDSKIVVEITRGSGVVVADNQKPIKIKKGDKVKIKKNDGMARIILV
ncbi:MAG: NAD(+)/NADH kinase [Nanoarchaeota archaeon]|nr:NAD(+)/NADH kinase [Nanoarchaeota archaeon]